MYTQPSVKRIQNERRMVLYLVMGQDVV